MPKTCMMQLTKIIDLRAAVDSKVRSYGCQLADLYAEPNLSSANLL